METQELTLFIDMAVTSLFGKVGAATMDFDIKRVYN
jgi:hypothetical protein